MNDRDLVQQTLRGDRTAYRRLIERYRNAVYGLVISYVGDFDQAEDLAQEAFIRGYYRLHTLEDGGRFGGWLRTIAANFCRMELRRRRTIPIETTEYDLDEMVGPTPTPDEAYEQDEEQRRVLGALEGLSRKDREAVTLYYLDGQRVEAVGRFLGISPQAVKGRLHRARQKLRKEMVDMAKKTLTKKQLEPEFADRVAIREFWDLARLTDEELRTLAGSGWSGLSNLAYSLTPDDWETNRLRKRILETLPEVEREFLEVKLDDFNPVQRYRVEVVGAARKLQRAGAIRPAPDGEPAPEGRKKTRPKGQVEIKRFADIARLTDEELQWALREIDTKDLAVALKPETPDVRRVKARCYENVSERVKGMLEEGRADIEASEYEVIARQERILSTVRQLQNAGVIRPSRERKRPKGPVEIKRFADIARLTDEELQCAFREIDTIDLAKALKPETPGVRRVKMRSYENVSERVRRFLEFSRVHEEASDAHVANCQDHILMIVHRLQRAGAIRPPVKGQVLTDRIDIRSFEDWARLNDREIQYTLRQTDTVDLERALKGKGPGIRKVEKRVMQNVSTRVGRLVRKAMDATPFSRADTEASQRKILKTMRRLQILGRIRPPTRRPTRRQYEQAVRQAAQDAIERGQHSGQWTPGQGQYRELIPYLALVNREEGIGAVEKAVEGVRDPVFELGLGMIEAGVEREELVQRLEEAAEHELEETARKHRMLIAGMAAMRDGEDPRDIGKRLLHTF